MSENKPSAESLKDRVLVLIDKHVSLIEAEVNDYVEYQEKIKDGTWDEDKKKPEAPRFLSGNLTSYLKALTDYQEAEDEGIGKQLKALQKMSKEQLEKVKADFDSRNK